MIRSKAAIILLFAANITLLVTNSLPHHHHGDRICFVRSHCHQGEGDDNHQGQNPGHSHDGEDGHCCVLREPGILPLNDSKTDIVRIDTRRDNDYQVAQALSSGEILSGDAGNPGLQRVPLPDIVTRIYSGYLPYISALRAPPSA